MIDEIDRSGKAKFVHGNNRRHHAASRLTKELRAQGFSRTRQIEATTWVLCASEGFWYPMEDGKVDTSRRISEFWEGGERWHFFIGHHEVDCDSTFKKLALRHSDLH